MTNKQEPVARVIGVHGGMFVVEPINRAMVLSTNMALYTHPQPKAEKQEPLTYLLRRQDRSGYETGEKTDYGAFPVYTQREWVGLTDEEFNDIAKNYALNNPTTPLHFAKAIEAALKEKNT